MKRLLCSFLAAVLVMGMSAVSVLAYTIDYGISVTGASADVKDDDGDTAQGSFVLGTGTTSGATVTGDGVQLGQKLYFPLDSTQANGISVENDFFNTNLFSFKLVKDENAKLISSVTATTKKFSSSGTRKPYIAVALKNATVTDEEKVTFDVYFKARKADPNGSKWTQDQIFNLRFSLWVNNNRDDSGDATVPLNVGTVIKPVGGDNNIVRWGEDRDVACLEYSAPDDPDSFYVKLSTKVDNDVYDAYGASANADLFFFDFGSSDPIDSTSRGLLTLYDPWSEEYDGENSRFDGRDARLYRVDANGTITDITDDGSVSYVDADETDAGIPGWQIQTRVLSAYILSDTDLDISDIEDNVDDDLNSTPDIIIDDDITLDPTHPEPPPTGSSDLVALAVAMGAFSLTAGALVLVKRRR